jgi:hypothetical protein
VIRAGLASDDRNTVLQAVSFSERFGLEPKPVVRSLLERSPHDQFLWQWLLHRADAPEVRALIDEMIAVLPLAAMDTGPAEDLGFGAGYEAEGCLSQVLQRMSEVAEPGYGWQLVRVGLNNRVIRARNMALRVLQSWPKDAWPPDASESLRTLLFQEPNEDTRRTVRELLKGG